MFVRRNVTAAAPAALVALALLTAGCAGGRPDPAAAKPGSATSAPEHGYVEGARETAEQQSRLLLNDPATGDTRVLDLITGKAHEVSPAKGTARNSRRTADSATSTPRPAPVSSTPAPGRPTTETTCTTTERRYATSGRAYPPAPAPGPQRRRHDRGDRSGRTCRHSTPDGTGARAASRLPHPARNPGGAVVPYAGHLLGLTGDRQGAARLAVHDRAGGRSTAPHATCEDPRATPSPGAASSSAAPTAPCWSATTTDASPPSGSPTTVTCPRRNGPGPSATAREATPSPRAAGDRAVWVLDVAERTWTRVETGPVVAVNTAGEGSRTARPGDRRRAARLRRRHRQADRPDRAAPGRRTAAGHRRKRPRDRGRPQPRLRQRPRGKKRATRSTTTTACASPAPSPWT